MVNTSAQWFAHWFKGRTPKRAPSRSPMSLTARLERDELDGGWIAECLELPGCMSQGDTREEALRNLIEAIGDVIAARMTQNVIQFPPDRSTSVGDERHGRQEVALCV